MFNYFIDRNFEVVDPDTGRAYCDDYYTRFVGKRGVCVREYDNVALIRFDDGTHDNIPYRMLQLVEAAAVTEVAPTEPTVEPDAEPTAEPTCD